MKTVFIKIEVDCNDQREAERIVVNWVFNGHLDMRMGDILIETENGIITLPA
jgi:hypothetical protein